MATDELKEARANMDEIQSKVHDELLRCSRAFQAATGKQPTVVILPFGLNLANVCQVLGLQRVWSDVDEISFGHTDG